MDPRPGPGPAVAAQPGAPSTSAAAEAASDPRPHRDFLQVRRDGARFAVSKPIANEIRLEIRLNGRRLLAMNCSELGLTELVLGFLWLEGLIASADDVNLCRVCPEQRLVEVETASTVDFADYERRRAITSACGGGVSFQEVVAVRQMKRPGPGPVVAPRRLFEVLAELFQGSAWYRASGGQHAAALAHPESGIRLLHEDLGRHNTIDKIAGSCLLRGIDASGHILLSTGRMSSDMVLKAGRLGVPILASRTSPTDLALGLAEELGITVVGYIRGDRLQLYTGAERIAPS